MTDTMNFSSPSETGASASSPTAPKRTTRRKAERKPTVETARSKLNDEIEKLQGHITQLQDFCSTAQKTPESCSDADAKSASRLLGLSVERMCGKLSDWREARAAKERQQLSELMTLLEGKLDVSRALALAREGAQADAVASALVSITE